MEIQVVIIGMKITSQNFSSRKAYIEDKVRTVKYPSIGEEFGILRDFLEKETDRSPTMDGEANGSEFSKDPELLLSHSSTEVQKVDLLATNLQC